jgi:hypothetical protein
MKLRIVLFLVAILGVVALTTAAAQSTPEQLGEQVTSERWSDPAASQPLVENAASDPLGAQVSPGQWGEPVVPGIEYREYALSDPNDVFVARMDRNVSDLILESSIAQGQLVEGRETVSSMADRYDDAINFWGQADITRTWGLRNDVVVAINGSFFDWESGVPQSGQVQSGWYAKRFDNLGGSSGFVWKLDRTAFVGGCVNNEADKQFIHFANGNTQNIDGINVERNSNSLVIYTPQYDSYTPSTSDDGVEVLVEMTRPNLVLPYPAYATGFVRAILSGKGATTIPFDHIVLSAHGSAAELLQENAVPGSEVQISQEITHYEEGCSPPLSPNGWTKAYASISGSFVFLKDGEIQTFEDPGATERHPRTAIVFNDDYIYFIVVDGRDVKESIGMTIQELAEFALGETIQATWGIAQDGGGSSTMVVNGEVKNDTYCNNYVCNYYTYLPVIRAVGNTGDPVVRTHQRLVANGMMMVVVQPPVHSDTLTPGETITATATASLRVGPGSNYESIATLTEGTSGIVLDHLNGLNGVFAKGVYWWKAAFSNATGWVAENDVEGEN